MAEQIDLGPAIEAVALEMTGRRSSRYEACTWQELGEDTHTVYREEAKELVDLIARVLERQIREQIAREIEASIVNGEARYQNCTCADGKECHPHACHRLLNTVTADEDTWPVHIKVGAWKALDPEIRRDAAAIARGDIAAATETTGDS